MARIVCTWIVMAFLAAGFIAGCDSDSPTRYGGEGARVDTTTVQFENFAFKSYTADGSVETGLELQWLLRFDSSARRYLRIVRHSLLRNHVLVHEHVDPKPANHKTGSTISAKERWIPIDSATPAGDYLLQIAYETGRLSINAVGDTLWTKLGSSVLDTAFVVTP